MSLPRNLRRAFLMFGAALIAASWAHDAAAEKKTVCTITVNSPDEKEAFRRSLPASKYQFVELVEHGRPDWLESACHQGVRCDILVISGHYDGGKEFFSDQVAATEFLPVEEMERASCSDSCGGLFSQLKEVYLFGCNTLNPDAVRSASAEIERSLVHSGRSPADARRLSNELGALHGESSRSRMQLIFKDVPEIYGFSSVAPLGPAAASLLNRYFHSAGVNEIGGGRANARLLSQFAGHSMTLSSGMTDKDARISYRNDVCQFADDRLSPAQKVRFVHALLGRDMAEVRMFLDRIEKYVGSLSELDRQTPSVAEALAEIAQDGAARDRYLAFARQADEPAIHARMIDLAAALSWLSPQQNRAEIVRLIGDELASDKVTPADVDLVCSLNAQGDLDHELPQLERGSEQNTQVDRAAILACMGSPDARAQMLLALTSPSDREVELAQVYLRYRPIADVSELRVLTAGIARMRGSAAQVRAIDALASQYLDPDSLNELARLFPVARSAGVQIAIAGILVRSDYAAIATPELAQTLRQSRLKASSGADMVDVLLRRLPQ